VLNLNAFRVLSDKDRLSPGALRLFMGLMLHFDLTHFRSLPRHRIDRVAGNPRMNLEWLDQILEAGLLVEGPVVKERLTDVDYGPVMKMLPTYKLNPDHILNREQHRQWYQEVEDERQRQGIMPMMNMQKLAELTQADIRKRKARRRKAVLYEKKRYLEERARALGRTPEEHLRLLAQSRRSIREDCIRRLQKPPEPRPDTSH